MSKNEFYELNKEYQKCVNNYYDKFMEGHNVNFENICEDIKEKMKKIGNFYKNMEKEVLGYQKKEKEETKSI